MGITIGSRIGVYEVASLLGSGGMGEVYRGRDKRLQRDVALKVLPEHFASHPERLAWFQREALVLASLNHPNIAQIYGLEESNETRCIVMELVEGETLADRLRRGPIPADEAMPIALQIATALETAHEKGIIHRDLKPANIKLTPDGTVKVLDFGLAKAFEDTSQPDLSNSPTLSIAATNAGVIIGTAGYMSPEQAAGKPADKRSDVWSFGVVVFEMLTGQRLFEGGETISHTLADVLRAPIDLARLPPSTPPVFRNLISRCLDRNLKNRLRDIGEARIAIENAAKAQADSTAGAAQPIPSRPPVAWIAASLVLAAIAAFAGFSWWRATRPSERPLMRFTDDVGADLRIDAATGPGIAISRDGSRIAYLANDSNGQVYLFTRLLRSSKPTLLSGADSPDAPPTGPFFSPDGQWIGFFNRGKLKKISVEGGAAVTLCDIGTPAARGAYWGSDGNILFSTQQSALMRVSSAGGTPAPATELNKARAEVSNRFAQLLPGGEAFLFTATKDNNVWEDATIEVQEIKTRMRKTLLTGGYFGRYIAGSDGSGHLLYVHEGTVFAAPMDPKRLEVTGAASPVLEDVGGRAQNGFPQLDVTDNGALIYVPGANLRSQARLGFLDSKNETQMLPVAPGDYRPPLRPSASGGKIAVVAGQNGAGENLFVYDVATNRMTQLTFVKAYATSPTWTPDEKHIVFGLATATDLAGNGIYWMRADGGGEPQRLLEGRVLQPHSFTPDGKRLAYTLHQGSGAAIYTVLLDLSDPEHPKAGKPELFLNSTANLDQAAFSPDGKWMAYTSGETQPTEVFVRPFTPGAPASGGKWQISNGGGAAPTWAQNGKELFYNKPGERRAYSVTYSVSDNSFVASPPKLRSERPYVLLGPPSLMPDNTRFIGIFPPAEGIAPQTHITFLLNFGDELRRRLMAAR